MGFHDQPAGLPAQRRREADELDGIAVAVQTAQYHALAGERPAVPKAIRIGRAAPRDRLAFPPGSLEAAEQHPAGPAARGALVRIVAGPFGPIVGGDGLANAAPRKMLLGRRQRA